MNNLSKLHLKIFEDMNDDEINECLSKLNYSFKKYKKGETIFNSGEYVNQLGIILSGSTNIERINFLGKRTILTNVDANDIFNEAYSLLDNQILLVDHVASSDTYVIILDVSNIYNISYNEAIYKLIKNLLKLSLHKSIMLSKRSFCIANKTIRERVISYLDLKSREFKSNEFDIPFDREDFADYLNVDRSALSNELSKMQDDGLIKFRKNHFIIKTGISD